MSNVVFLRIIYRNAVSLHTITSAIESVKGLKIRHLNLVSRGRDFVGVVALETVQLVDIPHLIHKIKVNRDVSKVEKISKNVLCY